MRCSAARCCWLRLHVLPLPLERLLMPQPQFMPQSMHLLMSICLWLLLPVLPLLLWLLSAVIRHSLPLFRSKPNVSPFMNLFLILFSSNSMAASQRAALLWKPAARNRPASQQAGLTNAEWAARRNAVFE